MKKNGRSIAAILGLVLSAALPLAAHAQAATPGIYAGVGLGQSESLKYNCSLFPDCKKKGTAWKLYSGYQFHRNWAVEFGFTDLGRVVNASAPGSSDQIKVKLGELTMVGSLPFTERVSGFGKAGFYYAGAVEDVMLNGATSHLTRSSASVTYGFGLQYFVYRSLGLRGEYQKYVRVGGGSVAQSDYKAFTAGVLWKFE
jgi:OOP family OmpA-OmpF porin